MENIWMYVLFALGIVFVVKGGDIFVDAAVWIADALGVPKFIVGATIVSLATTLPELLVSAFAAAEGKVDMAAGNAIGSVTANVGLIMAISILFMPMAIERKKFNVKTVLLLLAVASIGFLTSNGSLSLWESFLLFVIFGVFIYENIKSAKGEGESAEKAEVTTREKIKNVLFLILGTAGIVAGSQLMVDNGSAIAASLGVPENIIALTAIAIGTSLPELVTTISAIVKKEPSLSIGNIIGAYIIDMAMFLPVCAFVSGGTLPVAAQTYQLDVPVCFAVCAVALIPALISKRFRRWQGAVLLAIYGGYLVYMMF